MSVRLPRGIRRLFRLGFVRPEVERDVDDELAFHFEQAVHDHMARGLSRQDALRRARADFGDDGAYRRALTRIDAARIGAERRRERWGVVAQGLRSFVASAVRAPIMTFGIVATLALGVGANTTMYGMIDRLLLSPPRHIQDADRVYRVLLDRPLGGDVVTGDLSIYPAYRDLEAVDALRLAGHTDPTERMIGRGGSASDAYVASATAEFLPLLGVSPVRGRFFTDSEAAPGAALTAVLSQEYWGRAFGADPDVLGRTIEISGLEHSVIGVLPEGFTGVDVRRVDIWVPLEATNALGRFSCLENYQCSSWMRTVARLPAGTDIDAAAEEATTFLRNRARELGDPSADRLRVHLGSIIPGRGIDASSESRLALWLGGVSLIVLLIACANVLNLLSARSLRRRREVAVRMALGAGRRRVVVQALAESIGLALAGGAVALVLARWGGAILRSTLLPDVSFPDSALTPRVLGFTALTALVAGAAAGIAPALQASRADLARDLGRASGGHSASRSRLSGFLTNAQAAMSVVLLVGAGLFIQSMRQVRVADLGLDIDHLLQARLEYRDARMPRAEALALHDEAVQHLVALPGVRAATHAGGLVGFASTAPIEIPGVDPIPDLPGGGPFSREVPPGFFDATGIAVLRGRPIEASDGERVAVINETMARTLWPESDGLGECLLLFEQKECTTVIGVAENAAQNGYQDPPFMEYYIPTPEDAGVLGRALYVRTDGRPEDVEADVARLLRTFSPRILNTRVETLAEVLDPQVRAWRVGAVLFSLFGVLATTLAAVGLYAVLVFDVQQRIRDLGIRSALGAGKVRLLADVVRRGVGLTGIGLALGLGASWLAAPRARDLLFEVSPRDPEVLAGAALLLLVVTVLGSVVPAVHATRVDPMESLRSE